MPLGLPPVGKTACPLISRGGMRAFQAGGAESRFSVRSNIAAGIDRVEGTAMFDGD